jgi:hypothetical protein
MCSARYGGFKSGPPCDYLVAFALPGSDAPSERRLAPDDSAGNVPWFLDHLTCVCNNCIDNKRYFLARDRKLVSCGLPSGIAAS